MYQCNFRYIGIDFTVKSGPDYINLTLTAHILCNILLKTQQESFKHRNHLLTVILNTLNTHVLLTWRRAFALVPAAGDDGLFLRPTGAEQLMVWQILNSTHRLLDILYFTLQVHLWTLMFSSDAHRSRNTERLACELFMWGQNRIRFRLAHRTANYNTTFQM